MSASERPGRVASGPSSPTPEPAASRRPHGRNLTPGEVTSELSRVAQVLLENRRDIHELKKRRGEDRLHYEKRIEELQEEVVELKRLLREGRVVGHLSFPRGGGIEFTGQSGIPSVVKQARDKEAAGLETDDKEGAGDGKVGDAAVGEHKPEGSVRNERKEDEAVNGRMLRPQLQCLSGGKAGVSDGSDVEEELAGSPGEEKKGSSRRDRGLGPKPLVKTGPAKTSGRPCGKAPRHVLAQDAAGSIAPHRMSDGSDAEEERVGSPTDEVKGSGGQDSGHGRNAEMKLRPGKQSGRRYGKAERRVLATNAAIKTGPAKQRVLVEESSSEEEDEAESDSGRSSESESSSEESLPSGEEEEESEEKYAAAAPKPSGKAPRKQLATSAARKTPGPTEPRKSSKAPRKQLASKAPKKSKLPRKQRGRNGSVSVKQQSEGVTSNPNSRDGTLGQSRGKKRRSLPQPRKSAAKRVERLMNDAGRDMAYDDDEDGPDARVRQELAAGPVRRESVAKRMERRSHEAWLDMTYGDDKDGRDACVRQELAAGPVAIPSTADPDGGDGSVVDDDVVIVPSTPSKKSRTVYRRPV